MLEIADVETTCFGNTRRCGITERSSRMWLWWWTLQCW